MIIGNRILLSIISIFFSSSILSQHYLLPIKTSGFHLAPSYTFSKFTKDIVGAEIGYTLRGRLTGTLSANNYRNSYYDDIISATDPIPATYTVINKTIYTGLSYLVLKQEQHHTLLTFSVDAGYQYSMVVNSSNKSSTTSKSKDERIYYGVSIYRNFHIVNSFSISPSIGYGNVSSFSYFLINNSWKYGGRSLSSYYRFQLLLKLGFFFISPELQNSDNGYYYADKLNNTIVAGLILPIRNKRD